MRLVPVEHEHPVRTVGDDTPVHRHLWTAGPLQRHRKASKIMASSDRHGLPVACSIASASPHLRQLVEPTVEQRFRQTKPRRMIGDTAYDTDPLDQQLRQKHRIRLIAPNRPNRRRKTQDGRELPRYCRRWKIECLFAWLRNFPRLVVPGIS